MENFNIGDKVLCLHKFYNSASKIVFDKNGVRWESVEDATFYNRKAIISKIDKQKRLYGLVFIDNGSSLAWIPESELVLLESEDNRIITFNEYQEDAVRTITGISASHDDNLLLEGVMGLNGEAGEVIELVKKHIFQCHELDKEKIAEELSDCLWYLTASAKAVGYTLEDIAALNIQKRKSRYPQGFDEQKSINRTTQNQPCQPMI